MPLSKNENLYEGIAKPQNCYLVQDIFKKI